MAKPSVVIDFYGFDYPVYNNAPGTAVIKDKDALLPYFMRLIEDQSYYASCKQAQQERGSEWALLDGKNTERVLNLIQELIT